MNKEISKKPTKKAIVTKKNKLAKKPAVVSSTKVDYYPNRMTFAVSALAGTMLVLFAVIAVLGSR